MTWEPTPDVDPYGQYGRIPAKYLRKGARVKFSDGAETVVTTVEMTTPPNERNRYVEFADSDRDNVYTSALVLKEDIPWKEMTLSERQAVDLQYMH